MSPTILSRSRSSSPLHHHLSKHRRSRTPEHNRRKQRQQEKTQRRQQEQEEPRKGQLRRSSLPHDIRQKEDLNPLLNAEWDNNFFTRKHKLSGDSLGWSTPSSHLGGRRSSSSLMKDRSLPARLHHQGRRDSISSDHKLIDLEELKKLTLCLWTNNFAGTVDPRFHSEYFPFSKDSTPSAALRGC